MKRDDLLELTPESVTIMSNPGFVKRALRDIEAGRAPALTVEPDGTVITVSDDGTVTKLAPGGALKDARCTCPASGWCRHRVMLAFAYQEWFREHAAVGGEGTDANAPRSSAWTPASFTDAQIEAAIMPSHRAAARRAQTTVRLSAPGGIPTARLELNTVKFLVSTSPAHAACDCIDGSACMHVAIGVRAFRVAGDRASSQMVDEITVVLDADASTDELRPSAPTSSASAAAAPASLSGNRGLTAQIASVRADAQLALDDLWLTGVANINPAAEARLSRIIDATERFGWRWSAADFVEIRSQLAALNLRSSAAEPTVLLRTLAEALARLDAAGSAAAAEAGTARSKSASDILGHGVSAEAALAHLRLIGLGSSVWSNDEQVGVRIFFVSPDTGQVSALERSWPVGTVVASQRMVGRTVGQVAGSQVVTSGATRQARGAMTIAADRRRTMVSPLSPSSWLDVRVDRVDADPVFVRPRRVGDRIRLVGIRHVISWWWDAADQLVAAWVQTDDDTPLHLITRFSTAAPGAVDAFAATLAGDHGTIMRMTVELGADIGAPSKPLAIATDRVVLDLDTAAPTGRDLRFGSASMEIDADSPRLQPAQLARLSPTVRILDESSAMLVRWLRRGIQQQSRATIDGLSALGERLRTHGFVQLATEFREASEMVTDDPRRAVLALTRATMVVSTLRDRAV